ncbi:hypothetical protein B0T21DRAFT_391013 [Apiosordaria backusii]|uniref:Uncharacterized protein n=1 Tax=Apiosordaria backusii TaxID=314023 RepID=A0AA40EMX1_9PEZI|nr:hypothetical protein B0T21DRAFT_391013 [Apiosordaria backusii]
MAPWSAERRRQAQTNWQQTRIRCMPSISCCTCSLCTLPRTEQLSKTSPAASGCSAPLIGTGSIWNPGISHQMASQQAVVRSLPARTAVGFQPISLSSGPHRCPTGTYASPSQNHPWMEPSTPPLLTEMPSTGSRSHPCQTVSGTARGVKVIETWPALLATPLRPAQCDPLAAQHLGPPVILIIQLHQTPPNPDVVSPPALSIYRGVVQRRSQTSTLQVPCNRTRAACSVPPPPGAVWTLSDAGVSPPKRTYAACSTLSLLACLCQTEETGSARRADRGQGDGSDKISLVSVNSVQNHSTQAWSPTG